ncbi:coiled-coil domain-containing protein 158-like [Paramisgurnus dabryanus]|uniref:coiled-coil domain-containing protein 158-like n=1 Tax=Paramisgurnus dabryanus TaxID=90735 RepID=UPI0031F357CE
MSSRLIFEEHSLNSDMIRDENFLTNQIEVLKVENQQLKAALRRVELRLSTMESERVCRQVSLSEKICSVHQLTAEKQQMSAELGVKQTQLIQMKEEKDALTELMGRKNGENLKLKTQLQNVQAELNRTRSSLRTLEGSEGHGVMVAQGMQRQITAKREQIDFLQVQIHLLEETVEKLMLEKHQQALEAQRQEQELMSEKEIRKTLEVEVKASHTQQQELKDKAEKLEASLYKISDSFSECQDLIQKQEHDIMRLKLQHALDLKELQSQNLRNVSRSPVGLHQSSFKDLLELKVCEPSMGLKRFVSERRDDEHGSHVGTSFRRRSEEDRQYRLEPSSFRSANHDKQNRNSRLKEDYNTLDLGAGRICSGRRSPVYALLTSDLPAEGNYRPDNEL